MNNIINFAKYYYKKRAYELRRKRAKKVIYWEVL